MNNLIVLGSQWGDEGKGKIVDLLSQSTDIVCRFQGGHNAGHTIKANDKTFVLHLIPSGILHKNVQCLIGSGTVICPQALASEINQLAELGVSINDIKQQLVVSLDAHIILPYHKKLDQLREQNSTKSIGTTGRGIGPCYEDKVARRGIRIVDLLDLTNLKQKITQNLELYNYWFKNYFNDEALTADSIMEDIINCLPVFKDCIGDVKNILLTANASKKSILFEGAQGALLDIAHGTYPFVTSSSTTVGSAIVGTGAGFLLQQSQTMGVAKAYITRVGNGAFPTELHDATGDHIAKIGHEFGSTTGRPRRCGWLDLVALKSVVQENNITKLCLTKLDVLDELPAIKACISYKLNNGKSIKHLAEGMDWLEVTAEYKEFAGWQAVTAKATTWQQLPKNAQTYIEYIKEYLNVEIALISTGPERDSIIVLDENLC